MREVSIALWLSFSAGGLVYALEGMIAAHRDFASTSSLAMRDSIEHTYASGVFRSQTVRTAKLLLMVAVGVIAIAAPAGEGRSVATLLILVAISALIAGDAYFTEVTRKRLIQLYSEEKNGNGN